jgi:hypothetical protein
MTTPFIPPVVRVFRTILQLVVALTALVPLIVLVLHTAGVKSVNEAGLLAVAGAATTIVVGVQNALEKAGFIPTLGATSTAPAAGPAPLPASTPEPVFAAPTPAPEPVVAPTPEPLALTPDPIVPPTEPTAPSVAPPVSAPGDHSSLFYPLPAPVVTPVTPIDNRVA